ncbi:MAG TPA: hypothetical protein VE623_10635 [Acidimicrobiales bacterium]|nr:hypothetical protein [Acidimicrobiales bacterium]
MDDYPVKVGSMLFTMVDPHRGHEVAYNRWYERDHFYAGCMIGPWLFAGGRWVATRPLKDLRFPVESPFARPVDAGSFLSIYWVHEGHEQEHFDWAIKQVRWLYENGRGFNERTHAHTGLYSLVARHHRDADGVPLELALHHGYDGLAVVVVEPSDGVAQDALVAALSAEAVPVLLEGNGIAMGSTWRVMSRGGQAAEDAPPPPMSLGTDGGSPHRLVQLLFLEGDPTSSWDRVRTYAERVDAGGAGKVTFAAPFLATVVGTDTYTDQLW